MHLDPSRGKSVDAIGAAGFKFDQIIPWKAGGDGSQKDAAVQTGRAISALASAFEEMGTKIVLVVGDRVEAFAAAAAGHISGRVVAHVHGGDRALGLIDDSLRHAITKLAHVHFPATATSAARIRKLGENGWRVHRVGSPGLDGIKAEAATWTQLGKRFEHLMRRRYALLVLHPESADAGAEQRKARVVLSATCGTGFDDVVVIYPNNDPGSSGMRGCGTMNPGKFSRDRSVQIRLSDPELFSAVICRGRFFWRSFATPRCSWATARLESSKRRVSARQ